MGRERVAVIVIVVLAGLLIATVATADPAPIAERAPDLGWATPDVDPPTDEPEASESGEPEAIAPAEAIDVAEATETLTFVLQIVAFTAIALAAIFMARSVWSRRPEPHDPAARRRGGFATLAEVADTIAADADEHRAALASGTPRDAIVACWLRLETSVETAGVDHDPAVTSTELTADVLHRFPVDAAPVERLGALYREARFSRHELDEGHRRAAIAALADVHAALHLAARRPLARVSSEVATG